MRLARGLLALAMIAALLASCTKKQEEQPQFVAADATKIETALNGGKAEQATALLPELRAAFDAQPEAALPEGATVRIDQSSVQTEDDYGIAEAEVTGLGRFTLFLRREAGEWYIVHTQPVQQATSPATGSTLGQEPAMVSVAYTEQGDCEDVGRRTPMLFVHGLNSNQDMWTSETVFADVSSLDDVLPLRFDYEQVHSHWVDDPLIGPKLAERIHCLATKSREGGGAGKVVVVAHSMGGLAVRYAADPSIAPPGVNIADDLGLVVMIATPNTGSGLANMFDNLLHFGCDVVRPPIFWGPDPSEECQGLYSAVTGLSQFSSQIDELPQLPESVPWLGIAGDVHGFTSFFIIPIPISSDSDLVVPVSSAAVGGGDPKKGAGVRVVECTAFLYVPLYSDASCQHNRIVSDPHVKQTVVDGIRLYLSTLPQSTGGSEAQRFNFSEWSFRLPSGSEVQTHAGDYGFGDYAEVTYCKGSGCESKGHIYFYPMVGMEGAWVLQDGCLTRYDWPQYSESLGRDDLDTQQFSGVTVDHYRINCDGTYYHLWRVVTSRMFIATPESDLPETRKILATAIWEGG